MAQRRMFSNRIANSAKFLQMPTESQLLYFHLNLHADDDGVAESYPIMKMLGISPDAFKVLLAKDYIQQLNEDQVIVITDWLEHNVIRADRKIDSIYKHLLPKNIKVLEAKPRSDVKDNSKRLNGPSTDGIGKVRLGKVNTTVAIAPADFNWQQYVEGMRNHETRKDLNIIAYFFIEKKIEFNSKAKAEVAIRRHLKAAKELKAFDKKEIGETIRKLTYDFPKFTLETVVKELTK